mmetsp:Transcript_14880/g.25342  ORF Transcript_14880/g.25342 Transcript_14880/m.25342 type:complete len:352 (+) Transcript_14880:683-1738(+)
MVLLIYTATYVPYRVCFVDESSEFLFYLDCVVDSLFFIDIVLTFFTAQEDENNTFVTSKLEIATNYMKGWFFIDLFTTIPFQVIERLGSNDSNIGDSKVLRLMRIPRLYRLLRIFRLVKMFRLLKVAKLQSMNKFLKLSNSIKEILKIIGAIIFMTHLMGCFWFLQAKLTDFPDSCWVVQDNMLYASSGNQYLVAFYWAFQTLTTVGFGDISAGNEIEQLIAICWMVFGVGFYSYTIGNMTQMISSFDSDNQEIQNKLDTLKKFQQTTKISNRLFYRIKRHLENNQIQKKYHDSEELLAKLPIYLRDQVLAKTHGEVFKKIKFFRNRSKEFNSSVVHGLKPLNLGSNELIY